jgi:hypothetical protein
MAKTKEQRLSEVHEEAVIEFDNIQSALRDERLQCLQDRRFATIAGAQWEGPLQEQFRNKPKFEVNKVHLALIRVVNEYRNNRITVDFISKDGSKDDKLADVCDGLYRADEQDSCAEEAYDNAFEEAVGGGFGAWRLRACYEDEYDPEDDRQRVRIEPIFDADSSVFFDLNAKRQDKSDARKCFVITAMPISSYKDQYGDDPASWPKAVHQLEFDWLTPDVVYVAEYYCIEEKAETVVVMRSLTGQEETHKLDELDEVEEADETASGVPQSLRQFLEATGWKEVKRRKIKCRKVHKYLMNGARILEDCGYIAGQHIPIIPVYGKRWFIDNVERCMGHVRLAKDAQRLKNMQLSRLGEISALSPYRKPIFTPEQVAGLQTLWAEDNLKNNPYLLLNPITGHDGQQMAAGPIGYTEPPNIPEALAALLQITETDMQDVLGNQQAGEQLQPNMSGKAVELVQTRLDMQTFIYMSNMAKAMRRCGEVWLSMAKDIYVEDDRRMKTVGEQGQIESIALMTPGMGETGAEVQNDLSKAKFDVAVDVGPSSSSKRSATVRAITGLMTLTQDPQTLSVLTSLALMNMEGEGLSDANDYFRQQLLRQGVVKPTEQEAQQLAEEAANAQPDPQAAYLQAAAQEAAAKAAKANADTVATIADAEKTHAETAKIITEIDVAEQAQALEIIDRATAAQPQPADVTAVVVSPNQI